MCARVFLVQSFTCLVHPKPTFLIIFGDLKLKTKYCRSGRYQVLFVSFGFFTIKSAAFGP